jgi:hypothetical protein
MQTWIGVLQIAAYLVGFAAALGSLWQYRQNSIRERTRWLFELYRRFYEDTSLKAMRIRIDWGDTGFIAEEKDSDLLGDLDNFLNFFEFVAFLKKRSEITVEEIRAMFEYPLKMIAVNGATLAYVRKYGYEELDALLKELRYAS